MIECSPYKLLRSGSDLDAFFAIIEQFPFAAAVDFVDRVLTVHFELKPTAQIVEQIRAAVDCTRIDQHQEFTLFVQGSLAS